MRLALFCVDYRGTFLMRMVGSSVPAGNSIPHGMSLPTENAAASAMEEGASLPRTGYEALADGSSVRAESKLPINKYDVVGG